jgi:hypothetical protein
MMDIELRHDLPAVREFLKPYRAVRNDPVPAKTELVSEPPYFNCYPF